LNNSKSILSSKTVWAGISMVIYNLLAVSGLLPDEVSADMVTALVNSVLAIAAIYFRGTATTELTGMGLKK
jgi:uncharacterized membrane protein (DUF441 family)